MSHSHADDELLKTLCEMIAVNSVNPEWGGPGEKELSKYVVQFFESNGIECKTEEVLPGRFNVYATLPGQCSNQRVILEAHLDTVSVEGISIPPFEPFCRDGLLFGRGSCDVKGGLAAMMHAIRNIKTSGIRPPCDVLLAAVIDEEHIYRGVQGLISQLSNESSTIESVAIVAEPTDCRIAVANKGVLRWNIVVRGNSAHSSKPHLGKNAILDMMAVIDILQRDAESLQRKKHALVGSSSLCISQISGGRQINFVPDECCISIDRRMIPGETPESVLAHYRDLLRPLDTINVEYEAPMIADPAFETSVDTPIVQAAVRTAKALGINPEPCGVPFGCDITKLTRSGIPGIIFGPGCIDQAHTDNEYVEIEQVMIAMQFYEKFLLEYGR